MLEEDKRMLWPDRLHALPGRDRQVPGRHRQLPVQRVRGRPSSDRRRVLRQRRWDEALSYYRDFAELHPDHEKVPYTLPHRALPREADRHADRDQTATREALAALDQLIARYPTAPETREAEKLWKELRRSSPSTRSRWATSTGARGVPVRRGSLPLVLDEYPGLGLDAEALYKLGLCYTQMNRDDEAAAHLRGDPRELQTPTSPSAARTRSPPPTEARGRRDRPRRMSAPERDAVRAGPAASSAAKTSGALGVRAGARRHPRLRRRPLPGGPRPRAARRRSRRP